MFPRGTLNAPQTTGTGIPAAASAGSGPTLAAASRAATAAPAEPILCRHCGRTASNGIACEGMCVADSGY